MSTLLRWSQQSATTWTQLLPELVAQMRDEISAEIEAAYKKAFDPLLLDLNALKHELRKLSGGPPGEVVELPNPIGRLN